MNYNIDEFWRGRLAASSVRSDSLVKGWYQDVPELATFTEAPLRLSESFGDPIDPKVESLIFISAPGAAGNQLLLGSCLQLLAQFTLIWLKLIQLVLIHCPVGWPGQIYMLLGRVVIAPFLSMAWMKLD
ncbi:hypothetical protein AB6806_15625 [Bosea sp. RCC_152_1]|uniref:hypothetical protein n=1 Tax=Bosea sp. RCC_152_1 TaxID=3239228 RepID=UPI00352586B6